MGMRLPAILHALRSQPFPPPTIVAIKEAGLGPRHLNALHHIYEGGPMSVSELGARLEVALPTASLMVGELSRAGLVDRAEDEADRRRTIVQIAPAVRDEVGGFLRTRMEPLRRALARLTPAERAVLARGLELIGNELGAGAEPGPGGCPGPVLGGPPAPPG